jgi:glycyl-tRNA synthetase beta chain
MLFILKSQYLGIDSYPKTKLGALLAIGYRLDHLVGYFGVGLTPKGDQDPFALRRSALVIVKIILQQKLKISLSKVIQQAIANYTVEIKDASAQVLQYILDRLKAYYLEQGLPHTIIEPVLTLRLDDIADIDARIIALKDFANTTLAKELSAGYKRVRRILINNKERQAEVNPSLLQQQEEKDLYQKSQLVKAETKAYLEELNYPKALHITATLKKYVDDFFDNTMIMCEDDALRTNRISLLQELEEIFLQVGDLSLLHIDE